MSWGPYLIAERGLGIGEGKGPDLFHRSCHGSETSILKRCSLSPLEFACFECHQFSEMTSVNFFSQDHGPCDLVGEAESSSPDGLILLGGSEPTSSSDSDELLTKEEQP